MVLNAPGAGHCIRDPPALQTQRLGANLSQTHDHKAHAESDLDKDSDSEEEVEADSPLNDEDTSLNLVDRTRDVESLLGVCSRTSKGVCIIFP